MRRTPRDLAERVASRRKPAKADDGFVRETFTLPVVEARKAARAFLDRYPNAAYMSVVDMWRETADGRIEFTMKRLPSAD